MRQVVISRRGGPEVLRLEDAPMPTPGPGQLRIAVAAAGINFADILVRQGVYPGAPPLPCVPGHEISGVVDEVGRDVDPMWKGRAVLALSHYGGYAEYHVIDADRVLPKPADLEFPAAAGLPLNYVTAWLLLVVMGSLRADQTLLIQNAGGGVGGASILPVQTRDEIVQLGPDLGESARAGEQLGQLAGHQMIGHRDVMKGVTDDDIEAFIAR